MGGLLGYFSDVLMRKCVASPLAHGTPPPTAEAAKTARAPATAEESGGEAPRAAGGKGVLLACHVGISLDRHCFPCGSLATDYKGRCGRCCY